MALRVVLVEPLIPQNTGSIARLTAATCIPLHLIEPLGFELTDRYLKRAGLDYWSEVILTCHPTWEDFLEKTGVVSRDLNFFSKYGEQSYSKVQYNENSVLVFGNEEKGLSEVFHKKYHANMVKIPMENERVRSLNLATSVGIGVYEARRQIGL